MRLRVLHFVQLRVARARSEAPQRGAAATRRSGRLPRSPARISIFRPLDCVSMILWGGEPQRGGGEGGGRPPAPERGNRASRAGCSRAPLELGHPAAEQTSCSGTVRRAQAGGRRRRAEAGGVVTAATEAAVWSACLLERGARGSSRWRIQRSPCDRSVLKSYVEW